MQQQEMTICPFDTGLSTVVTVTGLVAFILMAFCILIVKW